MNRLTKQIRDHSSEITAPSGETLQILREEDGLLLADKNSRSLRQVYTQALKSDIYPYRYIRNRNAVTQKDQIAICEATVTVVGAGGLGGHVLQLLSRLGIGCLIVFDPDRFDETNLNRQVLSSRETLGLLKAECAAEAIYRINPAVDLYCQARRFHPEKDRWLVGRSHVIVDALDNAADRVSLNQMAQALGIPLVHGAIAGFEGRIMSVYPEDAGLAALYPKSGSSQEGPMAEDLLGVCGITPCITGALQAMEAVKIILKREAVLRNTLLHLTLDLPSMDHFQM